MLIQKRGPTINEIYDVLMSNDKRNAMIAEDIIAAVKEKRSPLILTEIKEHLEILEKRLPHCVEIFFVLKGGMGNNRETPFLKE